MVAVRTSQNTEENGKTAEQLKVPLTNSSGTVFGND